MGGIGEQLISIGELPQISILLVNPKVKLLTKDVFASVFKNNSSPFEIWQPRANTHEILRTIGSKAPNDLIGSAIKHAPVIRQVLNTLDQLTGVKTIGMSGSGATCFALFDPNDTNYISTAEEIMISRGWWTARTSLRA
jgi:4-diphosphocytidyl-2-C-methyl-D-erythritol kinase